MAVSSAHSANTNNNHHLQSHAVSESGPWRRDIASVSVNEVNRSRNLRQTSDDASRYYTEIRPSGRFNTYSMADFDGLEMNNTDNRKPAFQHCKDYAPKVKEEQPFKTFVIQVEAHDPDEHDKIKYTIEKSATDRAKFEINEKTGEIYTSYTFDRDEPIREKEVRFFPLFHVNTYRKCTLSLCGWELLCVLALFVAVTRVR